MRPERPSPVYVIVAALLSSVVFSVHPTWTQEVSTASKTPVEVLVLAPQSLAGSEAGIRFNPHGKLVLPLAPNQGSSLLRFRPLDIGYPSTLINSGSSNGSWQLTKISEPQLGAKRFIDYAPTEWFTYPISHNTAHYRAPDGGNARQVYGHSTPWAGQIMLRVARQAAFHPRVVRVFELVKPGLSFGKTTYPRWLGR